MTPYCLSEMQSPRQEEYLVIIKGNFCYFSLKPHTVTPYLNPIIEMVQMSGHFICYYVELTKNIRLYHQILPLSRVLIWFK